MMKNLWRSGMAYSFMLTINNYSSEDEKSCTDLLDEMQDYNPELLSTYTYYDDLEGSGCTIANKAKLCQITIGYESGKNGTPHLQVCLCFKKRMGWKAVKKMFPRAHLEIIKHPYRYSKCYCEKEGLFVSYGSMSLARSLTEEQLRFYRELDANTREFRGLERNIKPNLPNDFIF